MSEHNSQQGWKNDPLVRYYGGLVPEHEDGTALSLPIAQLRQVFDRNRVALDASISLKESCSLLITNSPEAHSLAYAPDGKLPAVLITLGFLDKLWSHIVRAAHTPAVLAEAFPFSPDSRNILSMTDLACLHPREWTLPHDRIEYCLTTHCFMLEHVVLHEIAHHLRDHHSLDRMQGSSVKALADAPVTGSEIEFDADVRAVELALDTLFHYFPRQEWSEDEALEQLFILIFAQLMVAQRHVFRTLPQSDEERSEYPPPVFRAILFSHLMSKTLHREIGGDWDRYRKVHDSAWCEAGFVAEAAGIGKGIWHGVDFDPEVMCRYRGGEGRLFDALERINILVDSRRTDAKL